MPVSLRSSQARQSFSTQVRNAARVEDRIADHDLDSEEAHSDNSSLIPDDSLSDLSMSSKLSASNNQYGHELDKARILEYVPIIPLPVGLRELELYLDRPRDDLSSVLGYNQAVLKAGNEQELIMAFVHYILDYKRMGESTIYSIAYDKAWLSGRRFSDALGLPFPDITYGLSSGPLRVMYREVFETYEELAKSLEPLKGIILPIFCVEFKGPTGNKNDAGRQNQNNGACGIRIVVELKRAAERVTETYVGRILALGVEVTPDGVFVRYHWITISSDGADLYWSNLVRVAHDQLNIQRLVLNVFSWIEDLLEELSGDIALLKEKIVADRAKKLLREKKKQNTTSRKRARSPSEIEIVSKPSGKKKRGG